MKRTSDLSPYANILPYASEIFGVYQPLLGWRSKRTLGRIEKGFANDARRKFEALYRKFRGRFEIGLNDDRSMPAIRAVEPGTLATSRDRISGSFVIDSIARDLPPLDKYEESVWNTVIEPGRLKKALSSAAVPRVTEWYKRAAAHWRS